MVINSFLVNVFSFLDGPGGRHAATSARRATQPFSQDITDKLLAGSEADNLTSLWMHKRYAGEMLRIIAGGQKFQCPRSLLEEKPDTLLGNPEKRRRFYSRGKQALMFCSTLPDVFNALLRYYEGERLERPQRVNLAVFLEQLEAFDLPRADIIDMLALEGIEVNKTQESQMKVRPRSRLQAKVYDLFEEPQSSTTAKVIQTISILVTVISVIVFALETLPSWDQYTSTGKSFQELRANPFFILNTICVAYFTFELIVRFIVCPQKLRFLTNFFNWVDLVAVLPYFVTMFLMMANVEVQGEASKIAAVRVLRLFRILRILDVNRYTKLRSAKLLFQALLNNIDILSVLLFLLAICNVLFAGFIYTFENSSSTAHRNVTANLDYGTNGFSSIPETFWFTLITMTSVGYGDVIPQSAGALFVACATGMTGIIFITFVLQSVVSEFHSLMISNAEYDAYSKRRHAYYGSGKRHDSTSIDVGNVGTSGGSGGGALDNVYANKGPSFCDHEMPIVDDRFSPTAAASNIEIVLNVNGAEFSLMEKELGRFPHTLLGSRKRRSKFFYPPEGTYYFPRDRDSFPSIHYFYRSGGNLRRPPTVDLRRFVEEVIFFDLGASALIDLLESEGITLREQTEPETPRKKFWWKIFERPEFNLLSRVVAIVSMVATAVSVIIFCVETMPELASPAHCENFKWIFRADKMTPPVGEPRVHINCAIELGLFLTETLCCIWFIVELVVRFIVTPSRTHFVSSFMNWVDLLAILPYVFTVVDKIMGENYEFVGVNALGLLRVMRLVKLIRLFKFSRHSKRIQMIADIIRASITELAMSVYFLIIACTLFGSLAYIAESSEVHSPPRSLLNLTVISADEIVDNMRRDRQHISSIPAGMYWAWITMLTIGYGDLVPLRVTGKFVGAATAIMGIIFWSLPLTIVSDKFNQFRQLYRDRDYLISVLRKCKRQRRRQEEIYQDTYGGADSCSPSKKHRRKSSSSSRRQSRQNRLEHRSSKSGGDMSDSEVPLTGWNHRYNHYPYGNHNGGGGGGLLEGRASSSAGTTISSSGTTSMPHLIPPLTASELYSSTTSVETTPLPLAIYETAAESCPTATAATAATVKIVESTAESCDRTRTVASAPRMMAAAVEVTDKQRDDIYLDSAEAEVIVVVAPSPPIVTVASAVDFCLIPATPSPTMHPEHNPFQHMLAAQRHRMRSASQQFYVAEATPQNQREVIIFGSASATDSARRGSIESGASAGSGETVGLAQHSPAASASNLASRNRAKQKKRESVASTGSGGGGGKGKDLLGVGQISAGDRIDSWADLNRYDDDEVVHVANLPPRHSISSGGARASMDASKKSSANNSPTHSAVRKKPSKQSTPNSSGSGSPSRGGTPPPLTDSPSLSMKNLRRTDSPPIHSSSPTDSPLSRRQNLPTASPSKFLHKRKSSNALLSLAAATIPVSAGGGSAGPAGASPPLLSRAVMASKRHAAQAKLMPLHAVNTLQQTQRRGSASALSSQGLLPVRSMAAAGDTTTNDVVVVGVRENTVEAVAIPRESSVAFCSVVTTKSSGGSVDDSKKQKSRKGSKASTTSGGGNGEQSSVG